MTEILSIPLLTSLHEKYRKIWKDLENKNGRY